MALYKFLFTVEVRTERHHAIKRIDGMIEGMIDGMIVSGSADLTVASDD